MALRVLMVVRNLATGTQSYTENMARELTGEGVAIMVAFTGGTPSGLGNALVRLDGPLLRAVGERYISQVLRIIPSLFMIRRSFRQYRPHVIFAQGLDEIGLLAGIWSGVFRRPAVSFVHDLTIREIRVKERSSSMLPLLEALSTIRQKLAAKRLRVILVGSEFMKRQLGVQFGVRPELTRLGAETEFQMVEPAPARTPFRLLFVGNLTHKKRPDVLLRALAELHEPDVVLRIIGDGPEKQGLKRLVQVLRIEDKVEFAGRLPKESLISSLRESHVCVVPSEWEGFGLAALEALAAGIPVICSDAGALPEIVKDGHNGLLIPVGDYRSFARAIERLYRNRELLAVLSSNGKNDARSYEWKQTALETMRKMLNVVNT